MAPPRRGSPAALLCALLLLACGGRIVATDSSSSDNGGDDSNDDDENSSDVAAKAPAPDGLAGSLPGTIVLGVRAFDMQLLALDSQYFAWLQDFAGHMLASPTLLPIKGNLRAAYKVSLRQQDLSSVIGKLPILACGMLTAYTLNGTDLLPWKEDMRSAFKVLH